MTRHYSIQVVDRALEMLDLIASASGVSFRSLVEATGLSASTARRLLRVLVDLGVVERMGGEPLYVLGPRTLEFVAGTASYDRVLAELADGAMNCLRDKTGETVSLYVREGKHRVCVHRSEGLGAVYQVVEVGQKLPLHCGASGKVLLAWMPDHERAAVLPQLDYERFSPTTPTGPEELEAQIVAARAEGVAISFGERDPDIASVAAPVLTPDGQCLAALSCSGPIQRFLGERLAQVKRATKQAADEISGLLAGRREGIAQAAGPLNDV